MLFIIVEENLYLLMFFVPPLARIKKYTKSLRLDDARVAWRKSPLGKKNPPAMAVGGQQGPTRGKEIPNPQAMAEGVNRDKQG